MKTHDKLLKSDCGKQGVICIREVMLNVVGDK